ncbi:MAG: hypothetical protein AABM33_12220 [Pseudomonadota bacterium]
MPADTLDPAFLEQYVADAKAAWRKHAQALSWEQKVAAIVRMREREAALKAARENSLFAEQCRRQLRRPLSDRIRFGFFRNPNPVRDQNVNRSFASLEQYQRFCEERYPEHYGYRRVPGAGRDDA